MVKRQLVSYSYTCDVCGGSVSDGESVNRKVSWEGTEYVVDVCATHSLQLGDLLTRLKGFVDAGNRVSGRRGRRAAVTTSASKAPRSQKGSTGSPAKRSDLGAVRAWARENGLKVSERGRIPADLLTAYDAASGGLVPEAPASSGSESPKAPVVTAAASRAPRGRRASGSTAKSKTPSKRSDLGAVRAWARENDLKVSERGRIPANLLAAYDAANNGNAPKAAPAARQRRARKAVPAAG